MSLPLSGNTPKGTPRNGSSSNVPQVLVDEMSAVPSAVPVGERPEKKNGFEIVPMTQPPEQERYSTLKMSERSGTLVFLCLFVAGFFNP